MSPTPERILNMQALNGKTVTFDKNFFNVEKDDYGKTEIFLGQAPGLLDSINKQYPEIFNLYKNLKTLDWDEAEYPYADCSADFIKKPKHGRMLLKNLGYQWELDSFASRISAIIALFDPCTEIWVAWQRISDNESVHGLTYSEIVRTALPNPKEAMDDILQEIASLDRLEVLGREMSAIIKCGHEYQLGLRANDQDTYNHAFMFVYLLLVLERVQFMSSFASTFAIGNDGSFNPVARGVQRICQDEWELHVEMDQLVMKELMRTARGVQAFRMLKPRMEAILEEVVASEINWNQFLFDDEPNDMINECLNRDGLDAWVHYSGHAVAKFMGLDVNFPLVESNPLAYMAGWVKIADIQQSPQEENQGAYKTNTVTRDDDDTIFDI